jgi:hypothetical protein
MVAVIMTNTIGSFINIDEKMELMTTIQQVELASVNQQGYPFVWQKLPQR